MHDTDPFAGLDFERDLIATEADFEALEEARKLRPMSAAEYMEWLALIERYHPEALAKRESMEGAVPFTLP